MHESAGVSRFAHVFPKFQHNASWVRTFLGVFELAGEDATAKAHAAFVSLSKDKRFTKVEREAAAKFAQALSLMFDPELISSPIDRLVRDLLQRRCS